MDFEAIISYLANEASDSERKELESWLAISNENQNLFDKIKKVWSAGKADYSEVTPDFNKAWGKINPENRKTLNTNKATNQTRRLKFNPYSQLMKIAAMIVVGVGLAFMFLTYYNNAFLDKLMMEQLASNEKEKREILLADGTKVWLNSDSKLWYPEAFDQGERKVYLEGEAFFDVTHNPEKPFLIQTHNTTTQVLGTSFNIKGYKKNSVNVTLVTGKVSFKNDNEVVQLSPGEQASWDAKQNSITKNKNKDINFLAWKTQNLKFETSNFQEVISTLENYFKLKIDVNNPSILNCKFTGTFTNPKVEELLDIFQEGAEISYVKTENGYSLSGPGCDN